MVLHFNFMRVHNTAVTLSPIKGQLKLSFCAVKVATLPITSSGHGGVGACRAIAVPRLLLGIIF